MKKTVAIIIVLGLLAVIVAFVYRDKDSEYVPVDTAPIVSTPTPIDMCYKYEQKAKRGFFDRAQLKMQIIGDNVTGEYKNLPAETDSKVGIFSGVVGPMDPTISARIADVWWEAKAEGMIATEQLKIVFGEGTAHVLFGAMKDAEDGTYVYENPDKLTPGFQMGQVDCEVL